MQSLYPLNHLSGMYTTRNGYEDYAIEDIQLAMEVFKLYNPPINFFNFSFLQLEYYSSYYKRPL